LGRLYINSHADIQLCSLRFDRMLSYFHTTCVVVMTKPLALLGNFFVLIMQPTLRTFMSYWFALGVMITKRPPIEVIMLMEGHSGNYWN
ncbi:MAG TPA: hypothetical protein VK983_02850, partial [Candidatus Limnocylindrales bacterium]|nr:hypothetical protein [Candidatus Limnocylindrales bacterium]